LTALGSHSIGTVGRDPTMAASSHALDLSSRWAVAQQDH